MTEGAQGAVDKLNDILNLEPLEHNLFRGRSPDVGWQRVFGGQVIGQALMAASNTVAAERSVHSLHGYFMRPGDPKVPILYEVDRIRDGRSFTTRRVVAIQHGRAIFSMSSSFQIPEDGLSHQIAMPEVPQPEDLMTEDALKAMIMADAPEPVKRYWRRERPIELRPVSLKHYVSRERLEPAQQVWFRVNGTLPDDLVKRTCVLAYASDMTLLDTSLFAHGRAVFDPDIQAASLDHAMWFHRSNPLDDWLLYAQDSPNSSGSRGFTRGSIFSRTGELIASVAQEGLVRLRS